jgi:phosphatidylserine decarboxylase
MFAKEGIPFIAVPLILAVLSVILGYYAVAVGFGLVMAFMLYFFRDPTRIPPEDTSVIVSAADGTVTRIESSDKGKLVSVFLSPLDVHINRSPIAGRITKIEYIKGRKMPATSNEASFINERNSITIQGEHISVVCTQIAGILARRIVCRRREGDVLGLGERFGLIKFSSRTDLLMPHTVDVAVKLGDRVRGGETVIARIGPGSVDEMNAAA